MMTMMEITFSQLLLSHLIIERLAEIVSTRTMIVRMTLEMIDLQCPRMSACLTFTVRASRSLR